MLSKKKTCIRFHGPSPLLLSRITNTNFERKKKNKRFYDLIMKPGSTSFSRKNKRPKFVKPWNSSSCLHDLHNSRKCAKEDSILLSELSQGLHFWQIMGESTLIYTYIYLFSFSSLCYWPRWTRKQLKNKDEYYKIKKNFFLITKMRAKFILKVLPSKSAERLQ